MKKNCCKISFLTSIFSLIVCNTVLAQAQPYECKIDSIEVFGGKLLCVSMTGYEGIAEGMYGNYTCKLSLAWFGMPALGGMPLHLLQFDIRPGKGIEPIAQKRTNLGLVAFADNGKGFYDIGSAQCSVYPEGLRAQYLVGEEIGCMELFKEKDIVRLAVVDSAYNIVRDLEFKSFRSASTLAYMDSLLHEIGEMMPKSGDGAPVLESPTQNAKFPGGEQKQDEFIAKNTKLPEKMQNPVPENGVDVRFVINEDGSLSDFEVVEPADSALDGEAVRVIAAMPRWTPANLYGKPVKMRLTINIPFITEFAHYPNGDRALEAFKVRNLVYPEEIRNMGIEGIVKVNFVVDEKGNLSDFRLANHVDPTLDAEALRVARLMPAWVPAKFHGKPVKSVGTVYFFFQRLVVPKKLP